MKRTEQTLEGLAACLEYPRTTTAAIAADTAKRLATHHAPLAAGVEALADWLKVAEHGSAEERYTILFDLKPVCTLNVGHHIYGDTYDRGALLAGLASDLRRCEIDYEHDLPDFLPTLLRLLGRLDDPIDCVLLTHSVLIPALEQIKKTLERSPGPWPRILCALPDFLREAYPKGDHDVPIPRRRLEVLPC